MKNVAFLILGLMFSSFPALATDCLDVAIKERQDVYETISYSRGNQNNRGYDQRYLGGLNQQKMALTQLIDLYSNASDEKCEGEVKEIFERLQKRAKRIKREKKEFEAPTCSTLMARIDMGRRGEFCEGGYTGDYGVDKIRKVVEVENRKRK